MGWTDFEKRSVIERQSAKTFIKRFCSRCKRLTKEQKDRCVECGKHWKEAI